VTFRMKAVVRQNYSRSSRKRPPWEFRKVVATGAGRLHERAFVSDQMTKQLRVVAYKSFKHMSEGVRVCTSQRTISACIMYYSKFVQEVNAFIMF